MIGVCRSNNCRVLAILGYGKSDVLLISDIGNKINSERLKVRKERVKSFWK